MKKEVIRMGVGSLGAVVLGLGLLFSGVVTTPHTAQAFWWPWWNHAHAQEPDNSTSTLAVSIHKYIDGNPATAESAGSLSFPMTASWNDPEGVGAGSGEYALTVDNSYQASTSQMHMGTDYSTSEKLTGQNVGASCSEDKPYALVGYTTGASLSAAAEGTPTTTAPEFTDLSHNTYVIVWNETCTDQDPTSGGITGEVTGGSTEETPGDLAVTSIDAEHTTAVANGTFEDGWKYVFNITVPSDEPNLSMKFDNWLHSNGSSTIPVTNNMRISSAQANNGGATVLLTAANTYSSPALTMTSDLDSEEDGIQVQVVVEVAVPADTLNGSYSTNYGVKTE